MEKAQGLRTLGDYRRAARDSLYSVYYPPESNSTSPYDAIKTALYCVRVLISSARAHTAERDYWMGIIAPGSEYEMRNLQLFYCIKLMEFAKTYHEVKSVDELFPDWRKSPDAKITVFTSAGLSYLEAAFDFVRELGSHIVSALQNRYLGYEKESNISYWDPLTFLSKTPRVDELEINPEPDIVIKTWFDDIMKGMQSDFPKSEFSRQRLETEFNCIEKQLEHEWNTWEKTSASVKALSVNKPQGKGGQRNIGRTRAIKQARPKTAKVNAKRVRDQVFISYSHKDKRWLTDLEIHLKPYVRNGSVTAWSDEQIAPGSKWFPEIKGALGATKVAVLLVTPNFLASDFIHEHELTPLLKEAETGGVHIIWIPVRACSYKETPLKDDQAAIEPDRPLANMKAERDRAWVRICEKIKEAVGR